MFGLRCMDDTDFTSDSTVVREVRSGQRGSVTGNTLKSIFRLMPFDRAA